MQGNGYFMVSIPAIGFARGFTTYDCYDQASRSVIAEIRQTAMPDQVFDTRFTLAIKVDESDKTLVAWLSAALVTFVHDTARVLDTDRHIQAKIVTIGLSLSKLLRTHYWWASCNFGETGSVKLDLNQFPNLPREVAPGVTIALPVTTPEQAREAALLIPEIVAEIDQR